MEYYKVRDVVREHIGGADAISEASLTWACERGLREIEKHGNFYWMEAKKNFSLVVDQGDYSMYTATSGGLLIPNYKDTRVLFCSDQTLTNPSWNEVFGPENIEEVHPEFADTAEGEPVVWTQEEGNTDVTMQIWPPNPDKTYSMRLYYYNWTSLPTDISSDDHEVLMRWPEALIYLAVEQGLILKTKNMAAGMFWHKLFNDSDNPRHDSELNKIQRTHNDRQKGSRIELRPRTGGLAGRRNWRRNREVWL
jgi:hypothetical protein